MSPCRLIIFGKLTWQDNISRHDDLYFLLSRLGKIIYLAMTTCIFVKSTCQDNICCHDDIFFLLSRLGKMIYVAMSTYNFWEVDLAR